MGILDEAEPIAKKVLKEANQKESEAKKTVVKVTESNQVTVQDAVAPTAKFQAAKQQLRDEMAKAAAARDFVKAGRLQAQLRETEAREAEKQRVQQEMAVAAKAHDFIKAGRLQRQLKEMEQLEAPAKTTQNNEVKVQKRSL